VTCVDEQNDRNHCGTCGTVCPAGQLCAGGACGIICGAGLTVCGSGAMLMCVNEQTDVNHCGTCGTVCSSNDACMAGHCLPTNDTCANAITVSLASNAQTLTFSNVAATNDVAGPCAATAGATVWYRFTTTVPELVYADTFGSTFDTVLYFANSCTAARPASGTAGLLECDNDATGAGCTTGGTQSQILGYFLTGTYYIVVAGLAGATGSGTLHIQHEPVGNNRAIAGANPVAPRQLPAGASTQTGTLSGVGIINATSVGLTACFTSAGAMSMNTGAGPEQTFFWRTCPEYVGGPFTATTCSAGTTLNPLLYVAHPNSATGSDCDDDNSACVTGTQMMLNAILPHPTGTPATVPAGAALHVFVVDSVLATGTGNFSVTIARP
jgi:hypothetical protein